MKSVCVLRISCCLFFLSLLIAPVLSLPETYHPVLQWQSPVSGDYPYVYGPYGIALNKSGLLFVTMDNNAVNDPKILESFTTSGTLIDSWSPPPGSLPEWFNIWDAPAAIAINTSECVHISNGSRIYRLQPSGTPYWGPALDLSPFGVSATAIDIDPADRIYIADAVHQRLFEFSSAGQYLSQWGYDPLNRPAGIAVDPASGTVWVSNQSYPQTSVVRYNSAHVPTAVFTSFGSGTEQADVKMPAGIAIDSAGKIYIVNAWTSEVLKIDSSGNLIARIGSGGPNPALGQLNLSERSDVTVDAMQCVYVTDTYHHMIQKFCPNETVNVTPEFTPNCTPCCCCCPGAPSNGNLSLRLAVGSDSATSFWLGLWTFLGAVAIAGCLLYLFRQRKK